MISFAKTYQVNLEKKPLAKNVGDLCKIVPMSKELIRE